MLYALDSPADYICFSSRRDERKAPDSPRSTKSAPHHAYSRKGLVGVIFLFSSDRGGISRGYLFQRSLYFRPGQSKLRSQWENHVSTTTTCWIWQRKWEKPSSTKVKVIFIPTNLCWRWWRGGPIIGSSSWFRDRSALGDFVSHTLLRVLSGSPTFCFF